MLTSKPRALMQHGHEGKGSLRLYSLVSVLDGSLLDDQRGFVEVFDRWSVGFSKLSCCVMGVGD